MIRTVALALALSLTVTLPCYAQQGSQPTTRSKADEPWLKFTISPQEREVLTRYYASAPEHGKKQKALPPGLQKKVARGGALPPGWQKKVARGEVMPAAVYERSEPLPREVVVKLPPPPAGTILVRVEGKIIRLLEATRTIIDVLDL